MRIVASAVVRNEAGRYLDPWLEHLLGFCAEVRLLDDGSDDDTVERARQHGTRVQVLPNDGASFFEDESAVRNRLLDWTAEADADLVLSIDADEFVGDPTQLWGFVDMHPVAAYQLTMREVWKVEGGRIGVRIDGLWGDRRCPILWRPPSRQQRGTRWRIPRRKLACGREPLAVRRSAKADTGVGVYHLGWLRVREREARAQRYFEHDQGRFHADRHLQSILWPDRKVRLRWKPTPVGLPANLSELAA